MIIYNENINISLLQYGIKIPISSSKSEKAIKFLKSHPVLKKHFDKWYIKSKNDLISKTDLLRVHSEEYINKLYSKDLEQEIIKTYELIDANGNLNRYDPKIATKPLIDLFEDIISKVSGSYQCCLEALQKKFCFFFGGGMHHAKKNYGEGFCLLNDVVVVIKKLQAENKIKNAWIIDVDVHKGDGTASLTKGDESIKTLSIHMAHGWPLDQPEYLKDGSYNPSFIPSDIDIPIEVGEDYLYVEKLKDGLNKLDSLGGQTLNKPDLALVVLGSDPYEKDELPSAQGIKLTLEQMKARDLLIYHFLKDRGISQAHLMAGGYGKSSWQVYAQFLEYVLLNEFNIE